MKYQFEKGKAYYANPALPGAKQKIVLCIGVNSGRAGIFATFSQVGLLKRAKVRNIEGRDTVMLRCCDGDYFVSAAVDVNVSAAAEIIDCINVQQRAANA